ncbi:hypothetical protein CRM22_003276 [Opisthorchis felineus]|uniref:ADP-ribosylation factor-like protein 2-binding protein n=1 Tax=Opisthorchis felineus TaxID=147828 RepID=A0A4S2M6Y9_OPIFE|nr:hypothetical protein CRM22_003276 [Opisthorchis felineus]
MDHDTKSNLLLKQEGVSEELLAGPRDEMISPFDEVIGYLEDIIMSNEFQEIQEQFLENNCYAFEDSDENKLCYTSIHDEYVDTVEKFLEEQLRCQIPSFNMEDFLNRMSENKGDLDGEIFEMLYTFTDFVSFKEMMLDYKKACLLRISNALATVWLMSTAFVRFRLQEDELIMVAMLSTSSIRQAYCCTLPHSFLFLLWG